jgi:antirestriction protein ArdC
MKRDLYEEVSARIVAELERGAAPWLKPWSATAGMNTACNAATNRPYSGCNVVLLWMARASGYRVSRYLTYKQALELGGHVRKGERGTKVYFVKQLQVRDKGADDESATRVIPMLREYTVFNVDQCENLPARVMTLGDIKPGNRDQRDATADEFLLCSGANIREGSGEAYYWPSDDFISLPRFQDLRAPRISTERPSMSWGIGQVMSRASTAICASGSATGPMRRRSSLRSCARPSFVPSSLSMGT